MNNSTTIKPVKYEADSKETHPFIQYFYPDELKLLSIEGENAIYHLDGPKKTDECFKTKDELLTFLEDLSSGPSSHNEDFTVSEHSLAINDWDILAAYRLSSSRLTRRKRSLLKRIAPYRIEDADDDTEIVLKRKKRLEMVHRYCQNILRRRSAKSFKRFIDTRTEHFSDVEREAEVLRKREFADKELNRSDRSEGDEPAIFSKVLAARRQAVILKYQKYIKSLPFRQKFQQLIYNNVNLEVPADEKMIIKAISNTEINTRVNPVSENKPKSTVSESQICVIDFKTPGTSSLSDRPETTEHSGSKNFELRRCFESSDTPTAHKEVQSKIFERIKSKPPFPIPNPKRRSKKKFQIPLTLSSRPRVLKKSSTKSYALNRSRSKSDHNKETRPLGMPQVSSHLKMVAVEGTPYFTLILDKNGINELPLVAKKHLAEEAKRNQEIQSINLVPHDDKPELEDSEKPYGPAAPRPRESGNVIRKYKHPVNSNNYSDRVINVRQNKQGDPSRKKTPDSPSKYRKFSSADDVISTDKPVYDTVDNLIPANEFSAPMDQQENCSDRIQYRRYSSEDDNFRRDQPVYGTFDNCGAPDNDKLSFNSCDVPQADECQDNSSLKHTETPEMALENLVLPSTTLAVIPASTFQTNQTQIWKLPEVVIVARSNSVGQRPTSLSPIVIEAIQIDEYCDVPTMLSLPEHTNESSEYSLNSKSSGDSGKENIEMENVNHNSKFNMEFDERLRPNTPELVNQGTSTNDILDANQNNTNKLHNNELVYTMQSKYRTFDKELMEQNCLENISPNIPVSINQGTSTNDILDVNQHEYSSNIPRRYEYENKNVSKNRTTNNFNPYSRVQQRSFPVHNNTRNNDMLETNSSATRNCNQHNTYNPYIPAEFTENGFEKQYRDVHYNNYNKNNLPRNICKSPKTQVENISKRSEPINYPPTNTSMVEILRIPNTVPEPTSRNRLMDSILQHENPRPTNCNCHTISVTDLRRNTPNNQKDKAADQLERNTGQSMLAVYSTAKNGRPLSEIEEEAEDVREDKPTRQPAQKSPKRRRSTSVDFVYMPDTTLSRPSRRHSINKTTDRNSLVDFKKCSTFESHGGGVVQLIRHVYLNSDIE